MPLLNRVFTILITLSCLGTAACSDSASNTENNSILFEPCEGTTTLECGEFEVPLIHDSTDNRHITIAVARLAGIGDGPHEPLLLNLGGPGSGVALLQEIAQIDKFPASVREHYDIIGFDQRGVSKQLRVDCDQLGNADSLPYPRDKDDVQVLINDATVLAGACSAEFSDSLQWVGSNAVAQDMDIMRSMLSATKLNIIGASFGTRVTMLYLERFPENSGRIVMDAPLRPNGILDSLLQETVTAQQRSFEKMLNACGTALPDCDRATVEASFVARVNNLIDAADQETFEAFLLLLIIAIEESDNSEFLAPLLIDYVFSGDPADMFALIQEFDLDEDDNVDDEQDNVESNQQDNASITLERAVLCADDNSRPSIDSLLSTLGRLNEVSDFFAEALLPLAATCVGWPEALDPMADIQTTTAPASLVIGGSEDVNTPISWAVETAAALGGVFLSSDHLGHTVVFERGNDCVDSIVVDFLIEGNLPPEETSCN